ncbi:helix-turn-helix transcriptional regulator [Amycolatopsis sp. NPDC051716]|uniref:helix-turn-helix domain-containing protein n=1 Tax=Amycolatopsis sp. NPDC051716 TaxID=3155804 RepID=UPI00343E3672
MAAKAPLDVAMRVRRMIESGEARSLRESAGLSCELIARKCEVGQTAVFRWERGDRQPRGRNLLAYHRVLVELKELQTSIAGDAA